MSYEIEFTRAADKAFSSLPEDVQDRIDDVLDVLERDPRPVGHKKLKGSQQALLRVRAGDYRVVYRVEEDRLVVVLIRIGHRKDVYRNI